ncbi:2OG-Fe dioxygenase family protein [Streptomyces sp. HUAS ZL42]|uniref:2OG-Fe dioxygenase family protein n=1 Tax=Streptomyces sp. HUAS ZL42 TaxID=3231715 RepID=UPI00345E6C0D
MSTDTREELRNLGYSLLTRDQFPLDPELHRFEEELAGEWNDLEVDKYLKNGSRFRERRYDRFYFLPRSGLIRLRPHRPYYQSDGVNEYAGGIERDVAPLSRATLHNPLLTRLIRLDFARFPVQPQWLDDPWDVQCHQFRIISTPDEVGEPTPEGPHRDEVDFGAIHLMNRLNVTGGESQVYSESKELITEFCLTSRMDTMFWADQKVLHAVRPITAAQAGATALRDVLILGYKRSPGLRECE